MPRRKREKGLCKGKGASVPESLFLSSQPISPKLSALLSSPPSPRFPAFNPSSARRSLGHAPVPGPFTAKAPSLPTTPSSAGTARQPFAPLLRSGWQWHGHGAPPPRPTRRRGRALATEAGGRTDAGSVAGHRPGGGPGLSSPESLLLL